MSTNPCKVCGGTDLNLVDGFYYCVECGTQDVNVRETVVEQSVLADGTFALSTHKRITIAKDGVEMSPEWYKWHAYNFILAGLTDELIALGAAPSVRSKILWIWTRYVKKYQNKTEMSKTIDQENAINNNNKSCFDNDNSKLLRFEDDDDDVDDEKKMEEESVKKNNFDMATINKTSLIAILYIALNLDNSDIQLYHLFSFIKEGRLSINDCIKFIPVEINRKIIPNWHSFTSCTTIYTQRYVRQVAMSYFKHLNLGVPIVPNLTKILDNLIKELCLPLDFRDFVLSLTYLMPCDYLQIDERSMKSLVRLPNYEEVVMSYVLLGIKICFGLDNDYEVKLSDVIDIINCNENHLKSYNLGHPEPSNRLFSFRDWYNYLCLRRTMLSKYNIHMAQKLDLPIDDYVLVEQVPRKTHKRLELSFDVAMDILSKIKEENVLNVINKDEFPPSLTPFATNVEVICQFIQDPEMKLQLSEDFSQYSIKYAVKSLELCDVNTYKLEGVSKCNKTINKYIVGLDSNPSNKQMVYVRNCDNQNWLKTKPPTADHVKKVENKSDVESDDEYAEPEEAKEIKKDEDEIISSKIDEEIDDVNIFDDDFAEINDHLEVSKEQSLELNATKTENGEFMAHDNIYFSDNSNHSIPVIPDNIDRPKIIQELIEIACMKYKIPVSKETTVDNKPKKRKIKTEENTGEIEVKRKIPKNIAKRGETKSLINDIISAYYETIQADVLHKISEEVRNVVQNIVNESENNLNASQSLLEQSIADVNDSKDNNFQEESVNESKIDESDESEVDEELLPKTVDPKYNADTHDIKQLYLKVPEDEDKDVFDVDDENLKKVIERKIEEGHNNENILERKKDSKDDDDSDDDLPLSTYKNEKLLYENRKKMRATTLEPFLDKKVEHLNYWIRRYSSKRFIKSIDILGRFDSELSSTFPKSFVFVVNECAQIVDCSAFVLYKGLVNLEQKLLSLNNEE